MSRSNDVSAPCLNETWGSNSMSGWLFEAVDTCRLLEQGTWSAGNSRAVFTFMLRSRPWLGAVCGDFGNGRKLHFPMKDVCCLSFHEPVVALRYEMTINTARNSSLVRVS